MAERLNRGEIWLLELPRPDKRRPVLILSRPSLIPLLHTVTVAAVTSTLRGSPTEVELGIPEGLKQANPLLQSYFAGTAALSFLLVLALAVTLARPAGQHRP